jgi:hypothetical protein
MGATRMVKKVVCLLSKLDMRMIFGKPGVGICELSYVSFLLFMTAFCLSGDV